MDSKVAGVLRGYINLTPAQRREFIDALNQYNQGTPVTQERLVNEANRQWITKVDLGPTSQVCGCCGR
ncbi:hypothetical protein [Streptacidiphilus anmyonensis]|uniref:hypothetical protein n=1 Tax=Streptacidiphilus anmyonensis TaxID=405782 RepID=UPI0005A98504|nr:hypothetical protein [Streptacidiphilus anmyonensis]